MRLSILLLICFLLPFVLSAQSDDLTIRGTVTDARTGERLPFVHITYAGNQYGAATNEQGAFRVRIPDRRRQDSLRFSFLGYEPLLLPLRSFTGEEAEISVRLTPTAFDLPALEVTPVAAEKIVRQAIRKLKKNYRTKPYRLRGFYRETGRQPDPNRLVLYAEGVIRVDKGYMWRYGRKFNRDPVRIVKGYRRTLDYALLGPDSTRHPLPLISQGVSIAAYLDVVRNPGFWLDRKQYRAYHFEFQGREFLNDRTLYRIRFEPHDPQSARSPYQGELWIEADSYAVVRVRYDFTELQRARYNQENKNFSLQLESRSFTVHYYEYQDRWFLQSTRVEQIFREKSTGLPFDMNMQFITTAVELEPAPTQEEGQRVSFDAVFAERVEAVTEDYWEDYNILEPAEAEIDFR